jgi:hypothetical protein
MIRQRYSDLSLSLRSVVINRFIWLTKEYLTRMNLLTLILFFGRACITKFFLQIENEINAYIVVSCARGCGQDVVKCEFNIYRH